MLPTWRGSNPQPPDYQLDAYVILQWIIGNSLRYNGVLGKIFIISLQKHMLDAPWRKSNKTIVKCLLIQQV